MKRGLQLLLTAILVATSVQAAVSTDGNATDSSRADIRLDGSLYFINNETPGSTRMDGYTLPGFYMRPHLNWQLDHHTTLQAGVHWVHFWGNDTHNDSNGISWLGGTNDSTKPTQVLPWLQARIAIDKHITAIIGSLENSDGHRLPLPLYNPERLLAGTPEAGVQMKVDNTWLHLDMWVDWRKFIWQRSLKREQLHAGVSAEPTASVSGWQIHMPLHIIWQHLGGEGRIDTLQKIEHRVNMAGGLGASTQIGTVALRADCMLIGYWRNGQPEQQLTYTNTAGAAILTSDPINFKSGLGIYPRLTLTWKKLWVETSYWNSRKFVPVLGVPHYSNLSFNTEKMTHDRIQVITLRTHVNLTETTRSSLAFEGAVYYYLPFKADRTGYTKVDGKSGVMYTYSLIARIHPRLPIKAFR